MNSKKLILIFFYSNLLIANIFGVTQEPTDPTKSMILASLVTDQQGVLDLINGNFTGLSIDDLTPEQRTQCIALFANNLELKKYIIDKLATKQTSAAEQSSYVLSIIEDVCGSDCESTKALSNKSTPISTPRGHQNTPHQPAATKPPSDPDHKKPVQGPTEEDLKAIHDRISKYCELKTPIKRPSNPEHKKSTQGPTQGISEDKIKKLFAEYQNTLIPGGRPPCTLQTILPAIQYRPMETVD